MAPKRDVSQTTLGAGAESAQELLMVVADVAARRANGQHLPDSQVIAAYPHLMPALADELRELRRVAGTHARSAKAHPQPGQVDLVPPANLEDPIAPLPLPDEDPEEIPRPKTIRNYSLISEISSGGQATVYKAIQSSTGRTVAIKVIFGGLHLKPRTRARFERETAVLASLNHPNIVRIVDRGLTDDGSHFLVMDYIDGPPLGEWVSNHPGTLDDLLRLFIKLADAVQQAHARGIIHRDLKPSNIRVDSRGEPHLLDFGIARLLGADEHPDLRQTVSILGETVGSLPWTSPEQAMGAIHELDARTDVYSLGVLLYELLTEAPPYSLKGSAVQAIETIRDTAPKPFTKVAGPRYPVLDRKIEAIVFKAMSKSPERRYLSAGELATDLRHYLKGEPTAAVPKRRLRRREWVWIALVACCLLGSGAWLTYSFSTDNTIYQGAPLPRTVSQRTGIELVLIPAGQFTMGSVPREVGRGSDEFIRPVILTRPFYLSTTEITRAQYRAVMGIGPGKSDRDDLPAVNVTWEEAIEFCKKLTQEEGVTYRLPYEAEWEYACRAGVITPVSGTNRLDDMGWYKDNADARLQPVKGKQPNRWGLYDMHGNAAEWCWDHYADQYITGKQVDPHGPVFPPNDSRIPKVAGFHRVVRGGSAQDPASSCRSAARAALAPNMPFQNVGFRVARDPANPASPSKNPPSPTK